VRDVFRREAIDWRDEVRNGVNERFLSCVCDFFKLPFEEILLEPRIDLFVSDLGINSMDNDFRSDGVSVDFS